MTIRRQPEDFAVREVLSEEARSRWAPGPDRAADFAVYELTKRGLTTPEATARLAKALGVAPPAVQHAGMKDKHAVTAQFVSAAVARGAAAPPRVEGQAFSAEFRGWTRAHLAAPDISANHFTVVVRDLGAEASREMERRADLLTVAGGGARRLVFVNYFGDQRMGSARHGQGFAARPLIRGDFEEALRLLIGTPARKDSGVMREFTRGLAGKWGRWKEVVDELPRCPQRRAVEVLAAGGDFRDAFGVLPYMIQQLCVEAYQSHLWNAVAREMVERSSAHRAPPIQAHDAFGVMLFPTAVDAAWHTLDLPMLAPDTTLAEPWRAAAEAVLKREEIALTDLRIPGLRRPAFGEAPRPLLVAAE